MGSSAKHVVFFDAYPHSYTGTARPVHLFAQHLAEYGFTAEVVLPSEGIVADRLSATGVEVTVVPVPASLGHYGRRTRGLRVLWAMCALPGYWWRLRRHLRQRDGVVHVTSHRSVILAAPAARLARRRVLWHVSGIEDDEGVSILCDLMATRTIALSIAARARSIRPWREQTVVPFPLDPRFDDPPQAHAATPPVIVTAGRLEPIKNHHLLLCAFAAVHERMPDARLRIIGGEQVGHEKYAEEIRGEVARAEGEVELAGWVEHPEEAWLDASVYVSTSRREGLGVSIIEAMACGLPVVFTSDVGLAGFVENGVSALVVPTGDAGAVADAVVRVLEDPELSKRLVAAGRNTSLRFSVDRVTAEMAAVFEQVLEGTARRR